MKKYLVVTLLLVGVAFVSIAATTWDMTWSRLDKLWVGEVTDTPTQTLGTNSIYVADDLEVGGTIYETAGTVTGTEIANVVRYIQLPIALFTTSAACASGVCAEHVSSSTAPGLETDDVLAALVWADGETTPALVSFRVPSDYASGGAFKVFATESDSTTPNEVDFDVYINQDGLAADSSATGQTPVALDGVTSTGTEITLTVATDFASLAAGDWVTLRIWRDNTADGTGDLEAKGVAFYYTATQ